MQRESDQNRTKIGPNLLYIRQDSDALPFTAALFFLGPKADFYGPL